MSASKNNMRFSEYIGNHIYSLMKAEWGFANDLKANITFTKKEKEYINKNLKNFKLVVLYYAISDWIISRTLKFSIEEMNTYFFEAFSYALQLLRGNYSKSELEKELYSVIYEIEEYGKHISERLNNSNEKITQINSTFEVCQSFSEKVIPLTDNNPTDDLKKRLAVWQFAERISSIIEEGLIENIKGINIIYD